MSKIKELRTGYGRTRGDLSNMFTPPIPIRTIEDWEAERRQPKEWIENLVLDRINLFEKGSVTKKILDKFSREADQAIIPEFNVFDTLPEYDHDAYYKYIHDKIGELGISGFYDLCPPDVDSNFFENVKTGKEIYRVTPF